MSGDDKSMSEILGEIRTLSRGETPPPCKEPEVQKVGHKTWLLVLPAMLAAYLLHAELNRWLGLSFETFSGFPMLMTLLMMADFVTGARPASRRGWIILAVAVLLAGMASVVVAVTATWLLTRFAPEYSDGIIAFVGVMLGCAVVVLLTLWSTCHLTRVGNPLFPRGANETGGDGA